MIDMGLGPGPRAQKPEPGSFWALGSVPGPMSIMAEHTCNQKALDTQSTGNSKTQEVINSKGNTIDKKNEKVKKSMKSTIHKWVSNAMTAPDPTQTTKPAKYKVKKQKSELVRNRVL